MVICVWLGLLVPVVAVVLVWETPQPVANISKATGPNWKASRFMVVVSFCLGFEPAQASGVILSRSRSQDLTRAGLTGIERKVRPECQTHCRE